MRMRRALGLLAAAGLVGAQTPAAPPPVEGRYHYASFTVKPGVAFAAKTQAGLLTLSADKLRDRKGAQLTIDHPAAAGASLAVTASAAGGLLAGGSSSGGAAANASPELFVAMRAPGETETVTLSAGEWSGVAVMLAEGKPRGLTTAFVDFSVGRNGVPGEWQVLSHEAAVDDVVRARKSAVSKFSLQPGGRGMIEIGANGAGSPLAGRYDLMAAAGGDFLIASPPTGAAGLIVALRRDTDANTMTLRGPYALSEIGARMSFAYAPDAARFFSTTGRLEAFGGTAQVSQRVGQPDRVTEFHGQVAYMVGPGGGGSLSPRLEQRRRNLAVGAGAAVLLTAQVAEAGQLSLLHGIGVAVRLLEPPATGELSAQALVSGEAISLYGRNLTAAADGLQVLVGGQPATVMLAAPNQINVRPGGPLAAGSKVRIEIESPGRPRLGPVEVTLVDASASPASAAAATAIAAASRGGMIAPDKPARPGDTVELRLTGALPPAGASILIDGLPASGAAAAAVPYRGTDPKLAGTTSLKVTIPAHVTPGPAVSVALAAPGYYVDLGEMAISPRIAPPPAGAASTH